MSQTKQLKRIISDYEPYINPKKITDKPDNIFVKPDDTCITKFKALIIGPEDTPYDGGFFFFDGSFPDTYPFTPPKLMMTTIDGCVRFNPNLYETGKVCLSILGTWNGPPWKPTLNLSSVLLSVQSLMSDNPICNEPRWEAIQKSDQKSIKYNQYIKYHTVRLAILGVLNNRFPNYNCFKSDIDLYFQKKYKQILNDLLDLSILNPISVDTNIMYFIKPETINFKSLYDTFEKYCESTKISNKAINTPTKAINTPTKTLKKKLKVLTTNEPI
jgi:ubiquitin-conjugating enzyme E2 Z